MVFLFFIYSKYFSIFKFSHGSVTVLVILCLNIETIGIIDKIRNIFVFYDSIIIRKTKSIF